MTNMEFWDYEDTGAGEVKEKNHVSNMCAKVHYVFRNYMGPVDQSDVKANVMGLTHELCRNWYEKQFAFLVETSICNAFANYNLDSGIDKIENFIEFFDILNRDFITLSPNFRKRKKSADSRSEVGSEIEGSAKKQKRSHHKQIELVKRRTSKLQGKGRATTRGLECKARLNLLGALRFTGKVGSVDAKKFTAQRRQCAFCGYRTTSFRCMGCDQSFCMKPPAHLIDPDSNPPRKFRADGLLCWQRLHGYKTFAEVPGNFQN